VNEYVGLTTLKSQMPGNGITGTDYDDELMVLSEAVARAIDGDCHRRFYSETAARLFDGDGRRDLWLPARPGEADLLSVTALEIDQDDDGVFETAFAESTDFRLLPLNASHKYVIDLLTRGSLGRFPTGQGNVKVTGSWGYSGDTRLGGTLGAEISSASATAVTMTAGHTVERGHTIIVDSEQIYVSAVATNALTVVRGVNGTTAATHSNGATVSIAKYPPQVTMAAIMQVNRLWKRRESAFANVLSSTDLGTVTMFRGVDPDISAMLAPLRLEVVG
jgi:hypothetical protein